MLPAEPLLGFMGPESPVFVEGAGDLDLPLAVSLALGMDIDLFDDAVCVLTPLF